jgi:hypothetical protein
MLVVALMTLKVTGSSCRRIYTERAELQCLKYSEPYMENQKYVGD